MKQYASTDLDRARERIAEFARLIEESETQMRRFDGIGDTFNAGRALENVISAKQGIGLALLRYYPALIAS